MSENPPSGLVRPSWPAAPRRREAQTLSQGWAQVFFYTFVGGVIASLALLHAGYEPPEQWRWTEMVLPLLAVLAALTQLARRVPAQNTVLIAAIMVLFSGAIVLCDAASGVPFGVIYFTEKAAPKMFGQVPLWLPLWWVAILVNSRETARLVMQPWRRNRNYGLWLVGVAAGLAVVVDLGWEPFAVQVKQFWTWRTLEHVPDWYSAPWVNFLGWLVTALVTLSFCTPWFMSKRPVRQPVRFRPAVVWGLLNLYHLAGSALRGLWLAVMVGLVLSAGVLLLAWRGFTHPAGRPAHDRPPEPDAGIPEQN